MVVTVVSVICLCIALAEFLHWRRCRRVAHLIQASRHQRTWTHGLPIIRLLCLGLIAWSLCILMSNQTFISALSESEDRQRRLMILLDVSPSMHLKDAGPTHELSRAERARDLIFSMMERSDMSQLLTTVIAFYNGAKPVVIDTKDIEIVRNIVDDLPLKHAFTAGKTDIMDAITVAAEQMKEWPADSTDVLLFSDGDTVPEQGLQALPAACKNIIIVGVGSPNGGRFIDGHQSRQDSSTLRRLARRLRGIYHDGNEQHIPSIHLRSLAHIHIEEDDIPWDLKRIARFVLLFASAVLAALPLLLHSVGSKAYRLE